MTASDRTMGMPQAGSSRLERKRAGRPWIYWVLIIAAVVWSLPLLLMLSMSLKGQAQIFTPAQLIPDPVMWSNYPRALVEFLPFPTFFKNSLIVSVLVVIGDVLSSAFIAYGFACLRFPGRRILFLLMISTMMVPFAVRMIPLFLIFKQLGWINTFLPLIVPSYFGTHAFFIFLLHEFFRGLPQPLLESARIDGANELRIWWHIVLPLSKPALGVVAILAFEQSWNDFLAPLIFINDVQKFTLPLGLYSLIGGNDTSQGWQYLMAATTLTILPVLALFFFAQRYFMEGIAVSGIKG